MRLRGRRSGLLGLLGLLLFQCDCPDSRKTRGGKREQVPGDVFLGSVMTWLPVNSEMGKSEQNRFLGKWGFSGVKRLLCR